MKKEKIKKEIEDLLIYAWNLPFPKMFKYDPVKTSRKLSPHIQEKIDKILNECE